jgi:uncharacterized protein
MHRLLEDGIRQFNEGHWYEAHETWEDLWRETPGEARLFYQGLVQAAVGLCHLAGGNTRGGRRVLERGMKNLQAFPAAYAGIDNRRLIDELSEALQTASPSGVSIRPAIAGR